MLDDLSSLSKSDGAVLMVEQNAKAALRVSDRTYVVVEGCNHMKRTATDLLDNDAIAKALLGFRRKS